MIGLVADLLDAGRIEAGTLSVAPEPSEVAALVDQARGTFISGGGRHAVGIDLPPDLPPVLADRQRIVQVLNNLLANAARHAPDTAAIRMAAERDGEHLGQLFRKYAAAGDREGGLGGGLGLAICKGLVEAHGGRIRAESGGLGTRVTFTIPVAGPADAGARSRRPDRRGDGRGAHPRRRRRPGHAAPCSRHAHGRGLRAPGHRRPPSPAVCLFLIDLAQITSRLILYWTRRDRQQREKTASHPGQGADHENQGSGMTPHLGETHAAVSLSRACASSKLPCIRTQCSASLHPIRSNASAIVGETPACPFSSRDSVFRVTPRRSAHWATVQLFAWMLSRISSPGCDGLRMDISDLSLVVVDQVHVYRFAISEAKDDSPIPRDAHAPLSATIPFELVQPPAGQVQVPWRTCILQRGQHTPDALHMVGVQTAGVISFMESP